MAKVMPGPYTAQIDEPFGVFLIGMRINKFFAFSKWIPTARYGADGAHAVPAS